MRGQGDEATLVYQRESASYLNETIVALNGDIESELQNEYGVSLMDGEGSQFSVPISEEGDSVQRFLSDLFGMAFGRWDLRIRKYQGLASQLPDPFAVQPIVPPDTLVGDDGLPATRSNIASNRWLVARPDAASLPTTTTTFPTRCREADYPIQIPWDGILIDGPSGDADIVDRIHEVFRLLFQEHLNRDVNEACGVHNLRDHITAPTGFFDDHLKRYTKSQRRAPIYWPLSTESGGYTVWLYYPRLNSSTLFTIVDKHVGPKLKAVEAEYQELAAIQAKDLTKSQQKAFDLAARDREELKEFEEELLRIANLPYEPDHDDGVPICAAPLYKLFRHKQWSEYLKGIWEKLEAGEYDWAHLAYKIWPQRVREKAKKDKSIAIAHGIEEDQ
jgi:hypothetical protein